MGSDEREMLVCRRRNKEGRRLSKRVRNIRGREGKWKGANIDKKKGRDILKFSPLEGDMKRRQLKGNDKVLAR